MTAGNDIKIREISDLAEIYFVEELQKEVWGVADREVFPALAMVAMKEVGALLLGAFDEASLVGFVFGFPGIEENATILHSDLLAVKQSYRSRNLGYRLKLAQREGALARGIEKITWTFDPLQALNAHLNFARLGVTSARYVTNFYGDTTSFLHSTGSDRLWVEWQLSNPRVLGRILQDDRDLEIGSARSEDVRALPQLVVRLGDDGEPMLKPLVTGSTSVLIEIPRNINEIAKGDLSKALRWRAATREGFVTQINAGFRVQEFVRNVSDSDSGGVYLLRSAADEHG